MLEQRVTDGESWVCGPNSTEWQTCPMLKVTKKELGESLTGIVHLSLGSRIPDIVRLLTELKSCLDPRGIVHHVRQTWQFPLYEG